MRPISLALPLLLAACAAAQPASKPASTTTVAAGTDAPSGGPAVRVAGDSPDDSSSNPLAHDWLDGTTELTLERWHRLLAIAKKDPEVASLVQKATDRLAHGSLDEFFRLFSICSSDVPAENSGRTTGKHDIVFVSLALDAIGTGARDAKSAQTIDEAKKAREVLRATEESTPDYVIVKRWLVPSICLSAHVSLGGAYDALVHELTHAMLRDPFAGVDPMAFTNSPAYLERAVLAPGDEVDAYVASARARLRLEHRLELVHPPFRTAFDTNGNLLVPRETLAPKILAPPPNGIDYARTSLAHGWRRALEDARKIEDGRRELFREIVDARNKELVPLRHNVEALSDNVGIYEKNVAIARDNHDAAAQAKFEAELAKTKTELPKTKKRVATAEASLGRVSAELAKTEARIAQIDERIRSAP